MFSPQKYFKEIIKYMLDISLFNFLLISFIERVLG